MHEMDLDPGSGSAVTDDARIAYVGIDSGETRSLFAETVLANVSLLEDRHVGSADVMIS